MKYAFFANKTKTLLLMGWILGIISGTLLFNVLNIESKNNILIYYKYICEKIDFSNVNKIDYFLYILKYRTKEIVICVLFGLTGYRVIFHSGFMWYLGMKNSILIAIFTIAKKQMALF